MFAIFSQTYFNQFNHIIIVRKVIHHSIDGLSTGKENWFHDQFCLWKCSITQMKEKKLGLKNVRRWKHLTEKHPFQNTSIYYMSRCNQKTHLVMYQIFAIYHIVYGITCRNYFYDVLKSFLVTSSDPIIYPIRCPSYIFSKYFKI